MPKAVCSSRILGRYSTEEKDGFTGYRFCALSGDVQRNPIWVVQACGRFNDNWHVSCPGDRDTKTIRRYTKLGLAASSTGFGSTRGAVEPPAELVAQPVMAGRW